MCNLLSIAMKSKGNNEKLIAQAKNAFHSLSLLKDLWQRSVKKFSLQYPIFPMIPSLIHFFRSRQAISSYHITALICIQYTNIQHGYLKRLSSQAFCNRC